VHDRLRRACRVQAGRAPEPTAAIIDSQSLRAAETVGAAQRGYDGAKKIDGTKRHIAVDTIGLLLAVAVTAASVQDRDGAVPLLTRMAALCPRISKIWADAAYAGPLVDWASQPVHAERWRSSGAAIRSAASWCCRADGWSSAPWPGWCATGAWPATTNAATKATKNSCAGR
jgi:transposase